MYKDICGGKHEMHHMAAHTSARSAVFFFFFLFKVKCVKMCQSIRGWPEGWLEAEEVTATTEPPSSPLDLAHAHINTQQTVIESAYDHNILPGACCHLSLFELQFMNRPCTLSLMAVFAVCVCVCVCVCRGVVMTAWRVGLQSGVWCPSNDWEENLPRTATDQRTHTRAMRARSHISPFTHTCK